MTKVPRSVTINPQKVISALYLSMNEALPRKMAVMGNQNDSLDDSSRYDPKTIKQNPTIMMLKDLGVAL